MELMLSLNSRDTQDYGNIVGLIFKVYFLPFSSWIQSSALLFIILQVDKVLVKNWMWWCNLLNMSSSVPPFILLYKDSNF